jgi:hypothetical protein
MEMIDDIVKLWPVLIGIGYIIYQMGQLRANLEIRIQHLEDNVDTLFELINKGK